MNTKEVRYVDMTSLVCSDPYKVGKSLQTILEGSLQTKDVIDCEGCSFAATQNSLINKQTRIHKYGGNIFIIHYVKN